MNYRTLGRTGLKVSEIGFGAWGIGRSMWIGADDGESERALRRALELGLTFIDTALAYGDGHSERLVSRVLRAGIHVATKIFPMNHEWPAKTDRVEEVFPARHIRACTERSLRNLGRIDLQQLHVWNDAWVSHGDWLAEVEKLKREGKFRFFGVSINDHQPENALRLIETGVIDTVQVIYNIFDQSPEDRLFPACRDRNIGVLARVPLDEGGLTGAIRPDTAFPEGDWRNDYFRGDRKRDVWERVQRMGVPLPETALRFVLSQPAVSTVIPGMRTVRHVESNCAISGGLSEPQVRELRKHRWVRNFYED